MECVYYKCQTCGFVYQVPSYWSDHAPDETMEMEHVDLRTKEICPDQAMKLVSE